MLAWHCSRSLQIALTDGWQSRHMARLHCTWGCSARSQAKRLQLMCRCRAVSTDVQQKSPPLGSSSKHVVGQAPAKTASYRAFLDFRALKASLEQHAENCRNRNAQADPLAVAALHDQWLDAQQRVEQLREERNANAKAMKGKLEQQRRQELIDQGKQLKGALADAEAAVESLLEELQTEGQRLPNMAHPDAPVGGEEHAREVEVVGSQRLFEFDIKDHLELGQLLDCIDFDTAAEVSGSKFVYLKRAAALLEVALVNWALQRVVAKGFLPMTTPDLVRDSVLEKCGFQPRADNTQVYSIHNSRLCLTGTAEVPLGAVYMDQIIDEQQLPIKLAAFGHCFRTEAGSGGSASKGLYRVHQFSKVEMFVLCTPQQSEQLLQELCDIEREMYTELGLHFKILDMPTGDLGAPAHRKFDVEAWMPGMQRYGEISSASNCTDYQSRRLNIRYRPAVVGSGSSADGHSKQAGSKQGKQKRIPTEFVHTLNATACAVPRMIVAILENFQKADGSVVVPEALRPFMGGMELITPPMQASL